MEVNQSLAKHDLQKLRHKKSLGGGVAPASYDEIYEQALRDASFGPVRSDVRGIMPPIDNSTHG